MPAYPPRIADALALAIGFAWAFGLPDHATGRALGMSENTVRLARRAMGLRKTGAGQPLRWPELERAGNAVWIPVDGIGFGLAAITMAAQKKNGPTRVGTAPGRVTNRNEQSMTLPATRCKPLAALSASFHVQGLGSNRA